MAHSRYHSVLRVSLLVTAAILLFDGGFVVPVTKQLSEDTWNYLGSAQTSVVASVPENELNTLSAELRKRQEELDARERALSEREIDARDFGTASASDLSTYILSSILFILTVLIVLNYFMDWSRARRFGT